MSYGEEIEFEVAYGFPMPREPKPYMAVPPSPPKYCAIDTTSPAYNRLMEAGFKLIDFQSVRSVLTWHYHIKLLCVCGTVEWGIIDEHKLKGNGLFADVALWLEEETDALTTTHLLDDGYTDAQIAKIREPYTRAGIRDKIPAIMIPAKPDLGVKYDK